MWRGLMKDIFRRYMGSAVDSTESDLSERHIVYCLVRFIFPEDGSAVSIERDLAAIIQAAQDAGGDVNQLLGDVLLVLFGVPVESPTVYAEVEKFIRGTAALPVMAIVGEDIAGLYGSVGCDSRRVVTAFSRKLMADLRRVLALPERGVYIRGDMAGPLESVTKSGAVSKLTD
jgi:hypothetical protein